MKSLIAFLGLTAVTGVCHSALRAEPQSPQRSVRDGVYTSAQAGRGESLVRKVGCANCHGSTLEGGTSIEIPPLVGTEFVSAWQGQTLNDLAGKLMTMPPDTSEKMSAQDYVDIMTLLLLMNGYPAGEKELVPDPQVLRQIEIVP
jgi:cytochrome c553